MADEAFTHPNLTLHGRHVPEPEGSFDPSAYDTPNPVTGVYQIGVEIDGVFVPIFSEKASKVLRIVEHAKETGQVTQGSPVEPPPPAE